LAAALARGSAPICSTFVGYRVAELLLGFDRQSLDISGIFVANLIAATLAVEVF
jgi:hypothetical protein